MKLFLRSSSKKDLKSILSLIGKISLQLRTYPVNLRESNLQFYKLIFQSVIFLLNLCFPDKDTLEQKNYSDLVHGYVCRKCKVTYGKTHRNLCGCRGHGYF